MPRYKVLRGIVNGQKRRDDGSGPPKELYKFKKGEVFESKDYAMLTQAACDRLINNGTIERTRESITSRVKEQEEPKHGEPDPA